MKGIVRKEYILYDLINTDSMCESVRKLMEMGTNSYHLGVILSFNLWNTPEVTQEMVSASATSCLHLRMSTKRTCWSFRKGGLSRAENHSVIVTCSCALIAIHSHDKWPWFVFIIISAFCYRLSSGPYSDSRCIVRIIIFQICIVGDSSNIQTWEVLE